MSRQAEDLGKARPTRVRYVVLVLIAMAPASAYLTRVISAFNTTLADEFHVSNEAIGQVMGAFALGYFFFQVPGGMLASAFGVRIVLPVMSIGWGLCAFWGSLARSPDQLFASRVALGVVQAGLVPCCAKVAADWFPVARRGIVSAVVAGSMQVGAVAATGLSAELLRPVGWRALLQAYAATGIAWAVMFFLCFRNRPDEHTGTNEAERWLIRQGRTHPGDKSAVAGGSGAARIPGWLQAAGAMALSVSLWAYFVQGFFRAYAYEFFTTWFPAYLEKAHRLHKAIAGELAMWPLVAFGLGSLLGGVVVDWLLTRSGRRWLSRSGSAIVGLGMCAASLAAATRIESPGLVVIVLAAGCLLSAVSGPATWAAGMDLGGRYTPVVFGVMNMIGNIGAYLCPVQMGRLFDRVEHSSGDWNLILWLLVGINLAGAAAWVFVNPRRPVVE